ncbi:MAG: flagellar basal body P-ring formation chaperone FlgA [Castellaniella sp.]|uniref:flagellar basal body P-ring formation chaperone FlgA n=1 Tax=Castellaniella sp. TaxID=1955812 RepID=UPI003C731080
MPIRPAPPPLPRPPSHRLLSSWLCLLITALPVMAALAQGGSPATITQDPTAIVEQVETLLKDRAASYPGTATIAVDIPRITNQSACSRMDTFLAGSGGLQSRTSVGVRCLAPQPWTLYVQASVQITGPYFVANRILDRGTVISMDDLDTREGDLLRLRRVISDPAHIVGWITTRRIRSGGPIEGNALRDPNSIERGQQVRTIARGPGFVVSGEGQALDSGNPGTQIQVRTPNGQIITGTVLDAHTVQVMM